MRRQHKTELAQVNKSPKNKSPSPKSRKIGLDIYDDNILFTQLVWLSVYLYCSLLSVVR